MQGPDYKYWAFISYSHADERWAGWLHKALERYRIPARLVGRDARSGKIPAKLFPVFRDRDELAGSSALGPELHGALRASRALIVICSPRAARSHWVNEEIKYFKSLGRADRVFALIVDGEPHALAQGDPEMECFPESLRFDVNEAGAIIGGSKVEPIAADVRRAGDGKGNALLKLIAGVLGIRFDDLKQRELQARNRRLAYVAGATTGIAALTIVLAVQAYLARNDAQRRQRQAEDLIQFMLVDLRGKLEPIGKLEILDAVGDKAMGYFATLDDEDLTDPVLRSRATALRQIGDVRLKQGNVAGARDAIEQALVLDQLLVARHPDDTDTLLNVSKSLAAVGTVHYSKGEIAEAQPWFERQLETAQRLMTLKPEAHAMVLAAGEANASLGAVALGRDDLTAARAYFEAAQELQQSLLARAPDNPDYLVALADTLGWLTHVESVQHQYERALIPVRARAKLQRRLVELNPEHAAYRLDLAGSLHQAIYNEARLRRIEPASPELREAHALTAQLHAHDPANVEYARAHAISLNYLEDAHLVAGRVKDARTINAELLALSRALFERAPEKSEALDDLLNVFARSAKLALLDQRPGDARVFLEQAFALPLSGRQRAESGAGRWLELALLAQWAESDPAKKAHHATVARDWQARVSSTAKPELLMRFYAQLGDRAEAARWGAKLSAIERAHPYVVQFCRAHPCGLPSDVALTVPSAGG